LTIEKAPPVKMKGVGNSLWVTIAPDAPLELIKTELARLFKPLKHLAHSAKVVLDTGVGQSSDEKRHQISRYLRDVFDLNEIVTPKQKERDDVNRFKMKNSKPILSQYRNDTLVMAGRVRSGQTVQAKKHLVIMGDINPGCELIAGGDILIFGSLLGTAAAGQPNNRDAIILALDFRPIQVKIGDIVAAGLTSTGQGAPEFAHLEEGAIVVDNYLAANPFKRISWPVIR
jgi:septum site-determining protein MinC